MSANKHTEREEFKNKTIPELTHLLSALRDKLQTMRFKVAQRQLKKVHEIKQIKKNISRVSTYLTVKAKK